MESPLFADIFDGSFSTLIDRLTDFAKERHMQILLLRLPKSDLPEDDYIHKQCFLLMSVGHKIALVNGGVDEDEFNDYCEDVNEIMSYLFSKYEYRSELGRYKTWKDALVVSKDIAELENLLDFWNGLKVSDSLQKKNVDLLITLCSGSINDIKRVKANVPETYLDQVRQKIQAFDADQTRFIYKDLDQKLVKIQGLSGTGKTELLLHKLKIIYQKSEKFRIFVTCHNKILAETLRARIPAFFNFMKVTHQIEWNKRLWCAHAWGGQLDENSGFYSYICHYYDIPFLSFRDKRSFSSVCKYAIEIIQQNDLIESKGYALDYILVDECQDFKPEFFQLCELVASKQVYVAGDVFQSIFDKNILESYEADYFLSKCYRTDNRTLMFAHALGCGLFEEKRLRWLSEKDWKACGYNCSVDSEKNKLELMREPVVRFMDIPSNYKCFDLKTYSDVSNLITCLISVLKALIEQNPTSDVNDYCIIFLDDTTDIYMTANRIEDAVMSFFSWRVNKAYESKRKIDNTLLISNRNNVKGLEYPFVICISHKLSSGYVYRNSLYTMLTRSFLQTILFLPSQNSGLSDSIKEGYNEIMREAKMTIAIPSEEEKKEIETRFNAATSQRPYIDVIRDSLRTMNISQEMRGQLYQIVKDFDNWRGLSESEIGRRLNQMKDLL